MAAFFHGFGWLAVVPLAGLATRDAGLAWGWAAIWMPALGALATAGKRNVAWLGALAGLALLGLALPGLPRPVGATLTLAGLAALGAGLGGWAGERRGGLAVLLLLVSVGLSLAPGLGGIWGPAPWSPEVAARLLACAPTTLVAETGGLDWLRHSTVYDPVGGDSIGPQLQRPWGSLAGAIPGVVGFAAVALRRLFPRSTADD